MEETMEFSIRKNLIAIFIGLLLPYTQAWGMNLNDFLSNPLTPFIVKIQPGYILKKTLESRTVEIIKAVNIPIHEQNIVSFDTQWLIDLINSGGQNVAEQIAFCINKKNVFLIDNKLLTILIQHKNKKVVQHIQSLKNIKDIFKDYPILDLLLFTQGKILQALKIDIDTIKNCEENNDYQKTHSRQHTKEYLESILTVLNKIVPLLPMIFKIHNQEIKILESGNYPFYHAQKSNLLMPNIVWKKLMEILYGLKFPETFYPLRFYFPGTYLSDQERDAIMQEKIERKGFCRDLERNLLFMQDKIFGNIGAVGECTLEYFIDNRNINNYLIPLKALFEKAYLGKFYDIFEQRLNHLENIAKNRAQGTLLQLSLSPEQIQNSVYLTKPYSYPLTVNVNGQKTKDVLKVLHALRYKPKSLKNMNSIMYCAVLSDGPDGLLNPFSKSCARIYYHTNEDLRDWRQKIDILFDEIAFSVMQDPDTVSMIKQFRKDHTQEIESYIREQQPKSKL
jgi:hypothetical protein